MTRSFEYERREITRDERIEGLHGELVELLKREGKRRHQSNGVDIVRYFPYFYVLKPEEDFAQILSEEPKGNISIMTYPFGCIGNHEDYIPDDALIRVKIGKGKALKIGKDSARLISGVGRDLGEPGASDLFYYAGMVSSMIEPGFRKYIPPNS